MDREQLLKDAFEEYHALTDFLQNHVFPMRKDYENNNGNMDYSVEAGMKSFDLLLQYSMLDLAVTDGKFDELEMAYIERIADYFSFPDFLNQGEGNNVTWEALFNLGIDCINDILEKTREIVSKISVDFITSFALFDAIVKEKDFCAVMSNGIAKIIFACIGIDEDFSEAEMNKNLLIYEAIHAIEQIKKDNEANLREREEAPNLKEDPKVEQSNEPEIKRLCDFYKESSHIVNFIDGKINYDQKEEGLIYIESENGSGSGFLINDSGIAFTCNHVVEGAKDIFVRLDNGEGVREVKKASVIYQDEDDDFALIQIQEIEKTAYFELEDNYAGVKTGDDIAIFGFPYGTQLNDDPMELEPTLNKGYVASKNKILDKKVFYLDARSAPGNSGGPVFSLKNKKVIGYLCGSYGSDRANLVFCRSLTEFYKSKLEK